LKDKGSYLISDIFFGETDWVEIFVGLLATDLDFIFYFLFLFNLMIDGLFA
jgi:hypothetical protein